MTTKCTDCGKLSFPPQADCPHCMSPRFAWESIGPEATLVTYTVVKMAPASFAQKAPYIVAIGEFVGGIRVLAWLEGIDPDKVEPGMRVRIETRTYDEGFPCYVFVSEGSN